MTNNRRAPDDSTSASAAATGGAAISEPPTGDGSREAPAAGVSSAGSAATTDGSPAHDSATAGRGPSTVQDAPSGGSPATATPGQDAGRGGWGTLAVVAGGLFLAVLSSTVTGVALPTIGAALRAGPTDLQWIVDAYVLVYASLLVAGGSIGDRRGRKGLFVLGLAIFGLGALVGGLASSVPVLLAGRVLQGLGPALVIPGSLTIIRVTFPEPRRRAIAIGFWSTGSGLALAVGPMLGGVIVDVLGWRWTLLFNVPLAAALALLAGRVIPRLPRSRTREPFDRVGALLTTAGIAALAFGLIEGRQYGWTSPAILGAFVAGVVALAAFVHWERRRKEPLVDVSLFRLPAFTVANITGLVVFFAFIGLIVYLSAYFQQVQGHSAVEAGADVSAIGIAFALAAPVSGRLVGRVGPLPPMLAGLTVGGAAVLGLLRVGTDTGIGALWWDLALGGFGIGMCMPPMTTIAVSSTDAAHAGMASAVHNATRQLGQVLGIAVLGALVYARLPELGAGRRLDPVRRALFVEGLHHALWVAGLALLATAGLVAWLFTRTARRTA